MDLLVLSFKFVLQSRKLPFAEKLTQATQLPGAREGAGGTPIDKVYGYVPLRRVWVSDSLVWDSVEVFDAQSRTVSQNQADLGLRLGFSVSQRHSPTQRFTEYDPPPGSTRAIFVSTEPTEHSNNDQNDLTMKIMA